MTSDGFNVHGIVVGPFQVNCWIVWGEPRQAIVIDPGADAEKILRFLAVQGLGVAAYVLTHGHVDHLSAVAALHAQRPAPVSLHEDDLSWAFSQENELPPYYPPPRRPDEVARLLREGDNRTDGGLAYSVLSTPGHSPGSICLLFAAQKTLFTGDTLFAGSIGRTDFPGGDPRRMTQSLRRLASLDPGLAVYPGHGPITSLAEECRTNFFLRS